MFVSVLKFCWTYSILGIRQWYKYVNCWSIHLLLVCPYDVLKLSLGGTHYILLIIIVFVSMHFVEIYHIPTRDAVCGGFPSCKSNSENTANHWLTVSHVEPRNARIPGLGATRNHPIFGGLRNLISFEIFRILKTHLSSFYPYGLWTLIWCIGVFRIVCVCFCWGKPQCSIISPLLCCQPWHLRNYDVPGIWCADGLLWLWQCLEEVEPGWCQKLIVEVDQKET